MFANSTGLAGNTRFCTLLRGRASSEQDSQGGGPGRAEDFSEN
jgi:hypothetical protein